MYKGKVFNRESVYVCGDVMDGDIYPVYQPAGKRRGRCRPTRAIQARLNQRNAERKLVRLILANFTEEDYVVHLTYRDGEVPEGDEAVQRELYNFFRRLKRVYKKRGRVLKYISCTECGEKSGRLHHHVVLSCGIGRDEIEQLWHHGYANCDRLNLREDGAVGLAHYMVKGRRYFRRWNQSRNLVIPQPICRDGVYSMQDVEDMADAIDARNAAVIFEEMYPGYELIYAQWERNGINRGAYIRFEMRRRREKHTERGRGRRGDALVLAGKIHGEG